jgi:hypothetical protein
MKLWAFIGESFCEGIKAKQKLRNWRKNRNYKQLLFAII